MAARDEGHIDHIWIESIGVCSHLAMVMVGLYSSNPGPASAATTAKHKEEDRKRRELYDMSPILRDIC